MTYLVMECHKSYAVVLAEDGRILKAANLNYRVGQRLDSVVLESKKHRSASSLKKRITAFVAAAACICLIVIGCWQYFGATVGTVRIQINPDILLHVNRFDKVNSAEALNADGKIVLKGMDVSGRPVDIVSDEIADRAVELGYLSDEGEIRITVDSSYNDWKKLTEEKVITELDRHFEHRITVTALNASLAEKPKDTTTTDKLDIPETEPKPKETEPAISESNETEPSVVTDSVTNISSETQSPDTTSSAKPIIPDDKFDNDEDKFDIDDNDEDDDEDEFDDGQDDDDKFDDTRDDDDDERDEEDDDDKDDDDEDDDDEDDDDEDDDDEDDDDEDKNEKPYKKR